MTLIQKRKLRILIKRTIRNEKKQKLYLLNLHWLKIKKQKERRRRRTFLKMWRIKQLQFLKATLKAA